MPVSTAIFVVTFVLAFPVLFPCALVIHYLNRRRLRIAAKCQPCPKCGSILGISALRAADENWRFYLAELQRLNPDVCFRFVRNVDAICSACGSHLRFHKASGTFILSKVTDESGAVAGRGND